MQINLHASGFHLTNHTRDFAQSKLLSTLGQFRASIGSVDVNLGTSKGRNRPDTTACEIVVNLHPSGEVRWRVEHEWMHVAIDRASSGIAAEVEREILQMRPAVASPPAIGDRPRDRALELVLDDNRISHHQREMLERPENYLRPVRVRERWRPPGAEKMNGPASRRSVRPGELPQRRRWSRPLSRVY
jgi:ribosomal subunit interface protein